ncbi:hypothetical protein ACNOYE_29280 [Nannocystaceae bacterium ST9]
MWRLLIGLALAPAGEPAIQQPDEPVVWALDWQAPVECPTRADVVAGIREYLPEIDEPASGPGRAELRLDVEVTSERGSWTAFVRASGREGNDERRFSAPACGELADAVALIGALALDPVLVARRTQVVSASELVNEPEGPIELPEPPELDVELDEVEPEPEPLRGLSSIATPDPSPRARAVELGIGVQGLGGWGPIEAGFGGLAGSFAVFAGRWRWQLDGGGVFPRTPTLADGRGARIVGWWLGSRGCVVPRIGAVELPACAGVEAGQVRARGVAPTTHVRGGVQPWVALLVSPGLRWAVLDRLALTADATLLVSLVRGRFVIGDEPLASVVPIGFRGALGLEVRF